MTGPTSSPRRVVDNADEHRYEIHVDGRLVGFAEYRPCDGGVAFVHTEIDPHFQGRGLASTLIRAALDDARDRGLQVEPWCSFVRDFIVRHDDYLGLVAPHARPRFGLTAAPGKQRDRA